MIAQFPFKGGGRSFLQSIVEDLLNMTKFASDLAYSASTNETGMCVIAKTLTIPAGVDVKFDRTNNVNLVIAEEIQLDGSLNIDGDNGTTDATYAYGTGGAGGGALIVIANKITGGGRISANGGNGGDGGSPGSDRNGVSGASGYYYQWYIWGGSPSNTANVTSEVAKFRNILPFLVLNQLFSGDVKLTYNGVTVVAYSLLKDFAGAYFHGGDGGSGGSYATTTDYSEGGVGGAGIGADSGGGGTKGGTAPSSGGGGGGGGGFVCVITPSALPPSLTISADGGNGGSGYNYGGGGGGGGGGIVSVFAPVIDSTVSVNGGTGGNPGANGGGAGQNGQSGAVVKGHFEL